MATVTGARGTALIHADQRVHEMGNLIKMLQPDETPFTTFLMQLNKSKTGDPKFESLEDELEPRADAVNGAVASTTTQTATVDNGAYFAEHDIVLNTRTSELYRVLSIAGNVLTWARGVGGSTAANINDNDEIFILGSAQPEGDSSKPARSSNPAKVTHYTQIFRNPWEVTGTAYASENQTTPHDWDHQANKIGIEHKRSIERAFLYSKAGEDTSGSQPRRITAGIINRISTNSTDAGGALTETEFNTFMRQIMRYGSKRKLLLAAPLVTSVLNTFAAGKVQITQKEKTYGVDVTTFTGPFGALRLATHWELEGAVYGGYAVAIDLENVRYRYLSNSKANRDSRVHENIQPNDVDTRKDEWRTECGLEVTLEETMGELTGVTG